MSISDLLILLISKKIFHHYSHFLFLSLSLCSHQSHHVDGYTCIGGYFVLFFKSSSYWKTFFFFKWHMKKKYVRFSPYSHVCCIHSHIISLRHYHKYVRIVRILVMLLCGNRRQWEWGAQKESFYFVVFNGMYVHIYKPHICVETNVLEIIKKIERK